MQQPTPTLPLTHENLTLFQETFLGIDIHCAALFNDMVQLKKENSLEMEIVESAKEQYKKIFSQLDFGDEVLRKWLLEDNPTYDQESCIKTSLEIIQRARKISLDALESCHRFEFHVLEAGLYN